MKYELNKKDLIKDIDYKISKIKNKNDYMLIFLDNDEKINISIDNYIKYDLSKIMGLDNKVYELLKKEERILLSYNSVLRKLASKDYTVKQIKDYLFVKKELHKDEVDTIINKLNEYHLLDDDRYCLNRFNYLNKQLYSIKQIKIKLLNEGIKQDLIDKYVIYNSDVEFDKVYSLVLKYSKTIKNKSLNAIKQAIMSKLVNVGYSFDLCKKALNQLNLKADNEIELLNKEYIKVKNKYSKKYEGYDLKCRIYNSLLNKGFKSEDIKEIVE